MRLNLAKITLTAVFSFLVSCKNDQKTDFSSFKLNIDTSFNQDNNNKSSYQIFEDIKSIPDSFFPNEFSKDSIVLKNLNQFSAFSETKKVDQKKYFKIENIRNLDNLTFGFYFFIKNYSGFRNYFYFIQKTNNQWTDVTREVITQSLIDFYKNNLNISLKFTHIGKINCVYTQLTDIGLVFDVNQKTLFSIDSTYYWQKIAQLVIYRNKIYVNQPLQSDNADLQYTKEYNDINDALKDSEKVIYADFSYLGLKKLTPKIISLINIQTIILDNNSLSYLPDEITTLKKIQIINCNNNELESLPNNIGYLPNLIELSLANNKISVLPTSLSKAYKIQSINLSSNNINNFYIDCSNLRNLSILNISSNNLSQLPYSIGDLDNLVSLDISNNPIEFLPKTIFNLKNLKYLNLQNTKIDDSIVVKLMEAFPEANIRAN